MKLFPLIFLLSVACYGQHSDTDIQLGSIPVTRTDLKYILTQYAQECYNDSTRYCYHTICDWGCIEIPCKCGEAMPFGIDECKEKYIHRKPTFEGFIEFVKTKK